MNKMSKIFNILSIIDGFFVLSNLVINKDKTMLTMFRGQTDKSYLANRAGIKSCTKFTLLGLKFDQCPSEVNRIFANAVNTMIKVAKSWKYRYLKVF